MNENFTQQLEEKPVITLATALLGAISEQGAEIHLIEQYYPNLIACANASGEMNALDALNNMGTEEIEALKRLPFTLIQQQILGMLLMYRDERAKDEEKNKLIDTSLAFNKQLLNQNMNLINVISEHLFKQNGQLKETVTNDSKLPDLWSRYFKEIDNGNPRTAVLESLVDLIKFFEEEEQETKRSKEQQIFIERNIPVVLAKLDEVIGKLST